MADVLSKARELKDSGDLERARALVDEAIVTYPKNAQLQQRKSAINGEYKTRNASMPGKKT